TLHPPARPPDPEIPPRSTIRTLRQNRMARAHRGTAPDSRLIAERRTRVSSTRVAAHSASRARDGLPRLRAASHARVVRAVARAVVPVPGRLVRVVAVVRVRVDPEAKPAVPHEAVVPHEPGMTYEAGMSAEAPGVTAPVTAIPRPHRAGSENRKHDRHRGECQNRRPSRQNRLSRISELVHGDTSLSLLMHETFPCHGAFKPPRRRPGRLGMHPGALGDLVAHLLFIAQGH